jgi:hypothetical protein
MAQTVLCEALLNQQIFKGIFVNAREDSKHVWTDRQMDVGIGRWMIKTTKLANLSLLLKCKEIERD